MSVNKAMILGRLGKDPSVKDIGRGQMVAKFTVATSEQWVDKNGDKKEDTQWHNVVAWGKLAELCGKHLSKGSQVFVEGKIQTRSYEKDGVKQYMTEVNAQKVEFCGGKVADKPVFDQEELKFDPPPFNEHSDLPF